MLFKTLTPAKDGKPIAQSSNALVSSRKSIQHYYNPNNELVKTITNTEEGFNLTEITATYYYNAFGRRIAKTSDTKVKSKFINDKHLKTVKYHLQKQKTQHKSIYYLWDGNRQAQEYTDTHVFTTVYEQKSFEPIARLVWLKADLLKSANDNIKNIKRESWEDEPKLIPNMQVFHYHNDHLGTPNELTNQEGEVVWLADYDVWGNTAKVVWREERLEQLQVSADELQPIRFQGQNFDEETGLHYNRFRYFDPDLGMFISRDPIGLNGGMNVFQYAPNPTGWIDPFGLCSTALGKSMGARAGDGMANHHLIPEQLMKLPEFNDMFTALESTGWHGDNASNGIFLPDKSSVKNIDLPGHWSNHKNYTSNVKVDLSTLNAAFKRGELSDLQLALGVKQVQDNARRGLETSKFAVDPCTGRLI